MALFKFMINLIIVIHSFFCLLKTTLLTVLGPVVIVKRLGSNYLLDTFYYYLFPSKLALTNKIVIAHIYLPDYSFTVCVRTACPCSEIREIIQEAASKPAPKRKNVSLYQGEEHISQDLGRLDRYYRHFRSSSVRNLSKVTDLLGIPCDRVVITEFALPRIKIIESCPKKLEIADIYH